MQRVSRKQLFELARTSYIGEDDSTPLDYKEFKTTWQKTKENLKPSIFRRSDKYAIIYDHLIDTWLKNNKDTIKFVGSGSSRAAFALEGGKCLKIATNEKGIAQNKQEVANFKRGNFICFTQIYDYDDVNYSSILTECCAEATEDDFKKLFKISAEEIVDELDELYNPEYPSYDSIQDIISQYQADLENAEDDTFLAQLKKVLEFWNNCLKKKGTQWDVMRDLIKFYENGGSKFLIPGDLQHEENWGLAIRNGKLVLVILDYGFSSEVKKKHY